MIQKIYGYRRMVCKSSFPNILCRSSLRKQRKGESRDFNSSFHSINCPRIVLLPIQMSKEDLSKHVHNICPSRYCFFLKKF